MAGAAREADLPPFENLEKYGDLVFFPRLRFWTKDADYRMGALTQHGAVGIGGKFPNDLDGLPDLNVAVLAFADRFLELNGASE